MQLLISRTAPLSLKEQLKCQLRALIESGEFKAGQLLPSAKDLAGLLGINRNTVAAAYQEMAADKRLESRVGLGTYVAAGTTVKSSHELQAIFDESLRKALGAGYLLSQVQDFLVGRIASLGSARKGGRIAVVECNREAIQEIASTLRRRLSVEAEPILMTDLEGAPDETRNRLEAVDLVVCGFNHVPELLEVIPDPPVEVVGVLLAPSAQIMNELLRLPPGSRVGFACVTERAARSFFKDYQLASGSRLTTLLAGADDNRAIRHMVRKCTTVFATSFAYQRVAAVCPAKTRLVQVDVNIADSSVELVRARLIESRAARSFAGSHLNPRAKIGRETEPPVGPARRGRGWKSRSVRDNQGGSDGR
jgi:DNA-binding transcriptional regulator YhcF (GntR family)